MPIIEMVNLKNNIVRTKDLLDNGIPIELDKNVCNLTNCYTYSLGILYNGTKKISFNPGFTEGYVYFGIDTDELIDKICIDLTNLNISFRKIGLKDKKTLKKHEYLIKVFYAPPNEFLRFGDYHVMRQDPKSSNWFHKPGHYNQPEVLQSNYAFLSPIAWDDPDIIRSLTDDGFSYELNSVCYFAITEPKEKKRKFKKNRKS